MLTMRDLVQHLRRCRAEPAVEAGDVEGSPAVPFSHTANEELGAAMLILLVKNLCFQSRHLRLR